MKFFRLAVFLTALFAALVVPSRSQARDAVSFDFFYDSLAPYGDWVEVDNYGLCWQPTGTDPNWSPYTDGYWAYTDAGWTWVSYEDFGGIVYHYGRWMRLEEGRWVWVPDYEWAPAWVSWRSSDDYVGWAPLPPWARWRRDVGISVWADNEYDIGPGYYRFCHTHDFGAPVLRAVMVDPGENYTIMLGTVNVTNITYNNDYAGGPVIFNGGPDFDAMNRFSARHIPRLKLVQNTNLDPAASHGARGALTARTVGNQLVVVAPLVTPPANPGAFASKARRKIAAVNISKGWNGLKNPDEQRQLREQIQRQTKGLTPATAPARSVAASGSNFVPKGNTNPNVTPNEEKHEKGHQPSPGNQPPPPAATAGGAPLKPFNTANEPAEKPRSSPPAGEAGRAEAQHSQEQEKMREEQGRAAQQRQAENAAREQEAARQQGVAKQQEAARMEEAARSKEAARNQSEEARPREGERHAPEAAPQQNGRGNPPSTSQGSPRPGTAGHSKDSKDKDKDKDKDRNGN